MALSFLPSETRRFSRPSMRFTRASRTSVLGPLFLGTASSGTRQTTGQAGPRKRKPTVNTRAVEDLASFASRASPVALDLRRGSEGVCVGNGRSEGYLALAAAFAVHGLARLVGDSAGRQAVDADLRSRHG